MKLFVHLKPFMYYEALRPPFRCHTKFSTYRQPTYDRTISYTRTYYSYIYEPLHMYTLVPLDVGLSPVHAFSVHANDNSHISVNASCAQLHYWSYWLRMYTVVTIHMYTVFRLSHGTYVYELDTYLNNFKLGSSYIYPRFCIHVNVHLCTMKLFVPLCNTKTNTIFVVQLKSFMR